MDAAGAQDLDQLRAGGYPEEKVQQYKMETQSQLAEGGYSPDQIKAYFGDDKPVDRKPYSDFVKKNLDDYKKSRTDEAGQVKPAESFEEAFKAGWGMSDTGLLMNQKMPDQVVPESADIYHKMVGLLGQGLGDLPVTAPGAILGSMVGAAVGGAAGSAIGPVGTLGGIALGAAGGGYAGANAAPAALRQFLVDEYTKGSIDSPGEFMSRLGAATWEGVKQGGVGLVTAGVGRFVGPAVSSVAGKYAGEALSPVAAKMVSGAAGTSAQVASEVGAMSYAGAAVQGRLPSKDDFMQSAIMIGGIHGVTTVMPKLMNIFAKTGEMPTDLATAAKEDVTLKQDLMDENPAKPEIPGQEGKIEVPSQEEQAAKGLVPFKPEDFSEELSPEERAELQDEYDNGIERRSQLLKDAGLEGQAKNIANLEYQVKTLKEMGATNMLPVYEADLAKAKAAYDAAGGNAIEADFEHIKDTVTAKAKGEEPTGPPNGGEKPPMEPVSSDEKMMLNQIGKQTKESQSIQERWSAFRQKKVDYLEELKNVGANDSYMKGRLFNAVNDKVYSFINFGTRGFKTGVKNGEAINDILNDNVKTNNDPNNQRLMAYWMAKRGLELDNRGIESLFPTKEHAEAAKRLVDAGEEKYQPIVDRLMDSKNKVLQYYADSGMLSQDRVEAIKELNESHLAMHTIQEADELTGKQGGSGGKTLKRIYGSLALKVDPLTSLYTDTEMMIKQADRNAVRLSALKDASDFLREVEPDMKKIDIDAREIAKGLGIEPDDEETRLLSDISIWRPEQNMVGPNQFAVWEDGKMRVFEGSPGVITALKGLDGNYVAQPLWVKGMSTFAKSLRLGTLTNPAFPLRHFTRSQRAAAVYSKTGMIPFWHPALVMKELWQGKSESYQNFLYDGGAVRGWNALDKISTEWNGEEPSWVKKTWNYVPKTLSSVAHLSETFIQATDNAARFSEYKRAVDQGYTREQAGFLGRNVTADYQRTGAQRGALMATVPFLNAHIQLTDKALQEATNPFTIPVPESMREGVESRYKTQSGFDPRLEFAAKAFAAYTVPAVLIWAASHNDSRMDQRPWWEKSLTLGIPIDNWRKVSSPLEYSVAPDDLKMEKNGEQYINDGPVMKLPVAGEPEIMFGSCVASAFESFSKKDPQAALECAQRILTSSILMPIPTAAIAPAEQFMNKNVFTGRPVVSWTKEKELPEDQQDQYTSSLAKGIASVIGHVPGIRDIGPGNVTLKSPMVWDNYLHDWFGGGGQQVTAAIDAAVAKFNPNAPLAPEKDWYEMPFMREWFDKFPSAKAQIIDDFHQKFKEASEAHDSFDTAQKKGDMNRMKEIFDKYGNEYEQLKQTDAFLKQTNHNIQGLLALPEGAMSAKDKAQLLKTMSFQMLSQASLGLKMFKQGQESAGGQ